MKFARKQLTLTWIAVTIVLVSGCNDPDSASVSTLFNELQIHVIGKVRHNIQNLQGEERYLTLVRDQCRDEFGVITRFLATNPPLTQETRRLVLEYRDASESAMNYYDDFIKRGEFAMTPDEKKHGQRLVGEVLSLMSQLEMLTPETE